LSNNKGEALNERVDKDAAAENDKRDVLKIVITMEKVSRLV